MNSRRPDNDELTASRSWQVLERSDIPGFYELKRNKAIKTVWAIVFAILVQVLLVLCAFLVQWYCSLGNSSCPLNALSIVVYVHICAWFFTLAVHFYLRRQHIISRRHGYGAFYRQTTHLRRIQFYAMSIGNCLLFAMLSVMYDIHYCILPTSQNAVCLSLLNRPLIAIYWVQLLVSMETLICLPALVVYLVRTVKFNQLRLTPDIFRESPVTVTPDAIPSRTMIGFRGKSLVDETIERQFDTINYLTARCEFLTQLLSSVPEQNFTALGRRDSPVDFSESLDTSLLLAD